MDRPQILKRILAGIREFVDMIELDLVFQFYWFVADAATKDIPVVKGAVDQAPRHSHGPKRLALCQSCAWSGLQALPSGSFLEG